MGSEKSRLKILNSLKQAFLDANEKGICVEKDKLISAICMDSGVTKIKASEYLQVLFDAKFIEEDELGLWLASGIKSQILSQEEKKALEDKELEDK